MLASSKKKTTARKTLIKSKHVNVITNGVFVSPAPLNAPPSENSIAINGCIDPSNHINITVNLTTSSLLIMNLANGSAKVTIMIPKNVMDIIESLIAPHPALLAWSLFWAPKCCPTNVAPAIENPNPITNENDKIWTPIPYAARTFTELEVVAAINTTLDFGNKIYNIKTTKLENSNFDIAKLEFPNN